MRRILFAALWIAASLGSARSDPAPAKTPGPVDLAIAAFDAKDAKRLEELARQDVPDPWLIADALLERGRKDVAEAFARAAPRPSVARLPAYVEAHLDAPDDKPARAALAAAEKSLAANDAASALTAIERVVPIGDDLVSVRALLAKGKALHLLGRSAESQTAMAEAAERADRIGALGALGRIVGQSADWAFAAGDLRGARAKLERTLAVRAEAGLTGGVISTRLMLAQTLDSLGEFEKARAQAETALAEAKAAGRPQLEATALGVLGGVCQSLSDFTNALAYETRALALAEQTGNRDAIVATLGNMSVTELFLGNPTRARDHGKRALAIAREIGDRAKQVTALSSLGRISGHLGDYMQALAYLGQAQELLHGLDDKSDEPGMLIETALIYRKTRDDARAEALLRRALALAQAAGLRSIAASALGSLADVESARGDDAKAQAYVERQFRTARDIGDRNGIATALVALASKSRAAGKVDEAIARCREALALADEINHPELQVSVLVELGSAERVRGEKAACYEVLEKAIRLAERSRAASAVTSALLEYAGCQLAFGDDALAMSTVRRAAPYVEKLVRGQADELGASTRARFAGLYDIGVAAAARRDDPGEACYFLESGRAGSLLEALDNRTAILDRALPEALAERSRKARARALYAQASYRRALDGGVLAEIAAKAKELDAAEEAVAGVRAEIQHDAKGAAGVFYPVPAPIEELERLLGADEVLVLYATATATAPNEAYALVVTKTAGRLVALGPASAIEAACEALVADDPATDPAAAVATLRGLTVDPLKLPPGTRRVLVSPDGLLSFVPHALVFGTDAGSPVVSCVPSGTAYASLREGASVRGKKVLALGDPAYATGSDVPNDTGPIATLRGGVRLARLPATRDEAKAVGDVVLLGPDATVEKLRAALGSEPRWRAVHLACHGLVRTDKGMLSSLALSPSAIDDGFLTAADVFDGLRVPTDLVVLSACQTSRGSLVRAEGVCGLTRAFVFAGSPRVISSLWKVDDDATRALMTKFYEVWKAGSPTATALRDAQAFVRAQERWKHPAYWAGWVLWGLPD